MSFKKLEGPVSNKKSQHPTTNAEKSGLGESEGHMIPATSRRSLPFSLEVPLGNAPSCASTSPQTAPARVSVTPTQWNTPSPVKYFSFGHPSFAPAWGRVTRGFDPDSSQREWQAEQILRRFGQWPPPEGEIYVVQIDQDSPPPPPPPPKPGITAAEYKARTEARHRAIEALNAFLTRFTGETSVFRAERVGNRLKLVELNTSRPFRSASHPGQLDPAGHASCNGKVCGMAWLRNGVYPYKTDRAGLFNPVQDSLMSVARDLNFDGAIDARESALSGGAFGFAIQIHPGFPNSPRSVGCQTLPPSDFSALQAMIANSRAATFSYVLVRRPNEIYGPQEW